jgi:hypothetical protein
VRFGSLAEPYSCAMPTPRLLVLPLIVTAAAVLTACGEEAADAGACAEPKAVTVDRPLPIDVAAWGTVTAVESGEDFLAVSVNSPVLLDELFERATREAEENGFSVVASDDEGIEFEVFFAAGEESSGVMSAAQTTCPGQTLVEFTLSGPAASAAGSAGSATRSPEPAGSP